MTLQRMLSGVDRALTKKKIDSCQVIKDHGKNAHKCSQQIYFRRVQEKSLQKLGNKQRKIEGLTFKKIPKYTRDEIQLALGHASFVCIVSTDLPKVIVEFK